MRLLCGLLFSFIVCSISLAQTQRLAADLDADPIWVGKELRRMGLSNGFTKDALKNYEPSSFHSAVNLNVMGFLVPPGQHMNHVTGQAARETAKFLAAHSQVFSLAQTKYGVSPAVISSLLWIETRHGDDMGSFHILSVYLHLLQADRPKHRKALVKLALQKNEKTQQADPKEIPEIMRTRTKAKSAWARQQLLALAAIRKNKSLDLKTLRGSYAGAFGLPQFIPSSYLTYAMPFKATAKPNLQKPADSIMSVANYLAKSGWDAKDRNAKIAALMMYNNSRDYAESILAISQKTKFRDPVGMPVASENN